MDIRILFNSFDILKSAQQNKRVNWFYLGIVFILAVIVGSLAFYLAFYMPELAFDQFNLTGKKKNGVDNPAIEKDKERCEERMSEDKILKSYEIYSPNRDALVYLEKAFNNEAERYVRQSVILENLETKNRIILDEQIICDKEEAISFFTDTPNELDETCCTVSVDYDYFKPVEWFYDDMVVVKSFGPCYECAGEVYWNDVYNKDGEKYFSEEMIQQADYILEERFQNVNGWEVENICRKSNGILSLILRKNMFGGFSYVEFDPVNKTFSNQMIKREMSADDNTSDVYHFINDCGKITNMIEVEKYFIKK